jgi:hypothetical protein
MKRSLILLVALLLSLAACSPAAAPATQAPAAQAPAAPAATREMVATKQVQPAPAAQPTAGSIFPTQAPAQAIQPTVAPLSTALPEFKAPQSGGVLNPPTLIPTVPGKSSVTSGQVQPQDWINYRDAVTGLAFQHPRDWPITISRNNKSTVESISVARANQPITNSVAILIDVRKKQGDLLLWLGQQLPIGFLLIDAKALEGGTASYKNYNARGGNNQAVFLFAPAHSKLSDTAAVQLADNQYFYQITYLGSSPDNLDHRATFLHLLNTLTLSGTTQAGLTLPPTAFTNGIDLSQLK